MTELAPPGDVVVKYDIAISREQDGSWTATIDDFGIRASGAGDAEARSKAQVPALRALADQIEHDRSTPDSIDFAV
jgi:predicted RNase H-like HicB family nuclease